jgi:tetratricopeptide (TPR) repeat protein
VVRAARVALIVGSCAWSACASNALPASPKPPGADARTYVDLAGPLEQAGCLDCLIDAFHHFDAAAMDATAPAALSVDAVRGSIRTALLIELRERELGTSNDGYLQHAKDVLAAHPDLAKDFLTLISTVETTAWRSQRGTVTDPAGLQRTRTIQASREAWTQILRQRADEDALSASLWIAFSCVNSPPAERTRAALLAPLSRQRNAASVVYELSTCAPLDEKSLTDLFEREPRFKEVEFSLANAALAARQLTAKRLDEAQAHFTAAFEWHPRWPSAALTLADIYMTAEDFEPALTFYDTTLMLSPELPDALVGRVRALSYLGRYTDALAGVNDLDRVSWFPGEAMYWRAWNEMQVARLEDAWTHVQQAERLWVNADVSKLAGIVARKRGELAVARGKFETAKSLNPLDCDTLFDLASVHADLRGWQASADVFVDAAGCFEGAMASLAADIARIEAADESTARGMRQIAARRQQLETADRMLAQSWFNAAADYFNLARKAEARQYADKVVNDPQFGARARDLLIRLGN